MKLFFVFVFVFCEHEKGSSMTATVVVEIPTVNFEMPSDLDSLAVATIAIVELPYLSKLPSKFGHIGSSMVATGLPDLQP
ncbi:hypothetical protein NL676_005061 [Syzygium grande]|nr:hypothetical protein NL676_005061 [Syzygium grande]